MGRSATLCGGKPPKDWNLILGNRNQLKKNLTVYLQSEPCVDGARIDARDHGSYLDHLTRSYVTIIQKEFLSLKGRDEGYGTTISFSVIYTELWRQATLISANHPTTTTNEIRWLSNAGNVASEAISIDALETLNSSQQNATLESKENEFLLDIAQLLSSAYVKAHEECRIAATRQNPVEIRHHMALLGDILQEMLDLHATLLPATPKDKDSY